MSILTVAEADALRPTPFVAEHVSAVPDVSVVSVVGLHPEDDVTPDSGSETVQVTVTLLVYQPLLPRVPAMVGTTTGGVVSTATLVVASAIVFAPSSFPT